MGAFVGVGDGDGLEGLAQPRAIALAPAFPASADRLRDAADTFDAVLYGRRAAAPEAARDLVALDTTLATTRPVLPEVPSQAGAGR